MNPRRRARDVRDPQGWRDLLRRMEQAVAEVRSLARTWGAELDRGEVPDAEFLDPWSRLLGEAGGRPATPTPRPCTTYAAASTSSSTP